MHVARCSGMHAPTTRPRTRTRTSAHNAPCQPLVPPSCPQLCPAATRPPSCLSPPTSCTRCSALPPFPPSMQAGTQPRCIHPLSSNHRLIATPPALSPTTTNSTQLNSCRQGHKCNWHGKCFNNTPPVFSSPQREFGSTSYTPALHYVLLLGAAITTQPQPLERGLTGCCLRLPMREVPGFNCNLVRGKAGCTLDPLVSGAGEADAQ